MMIKTKWIAPAGVGALAVGVGAWAVSAFLAAPAEAPPAVPEDFRKENIVALAKEDPGKVWEKVREASDRIDLTEAQKEQIRDNAREVFEAEMQARMDEYFQAPPEQKEQVLDKHIDEFERRRQEWEKRRQEEEAQAAADPAKAQEREKRREQWRERMRNMSQAERKERSESRDPNQRAQRMAYFTAMRARMEARGMQPPERGPWRRG